MQVNNFRIFLTILTSLGPFFAYICKLNISLTIEDMVLRGPNPSVEPVNCSREFLYDYLKDVGATTYTEEQALALTSPGSISNWRLSELVRRRRVERCKLRSIYALNGYEYQALDAHSLAFKIDRTEGADQIEEQPPQSSPSISNNLLDWSKEEKDFLLSAYFIGYVIVQVPVARMAEVLGAKPVFLAVGLGTSLCSLLFPAACFWSITYASALRVVLGAFQAGMFPAAYVLLCEWLPKNERSKWLPWPAAFSRFGTIAMNLVVPLVVLHLNWQWVFYLSGGATLAWTLLFAVFSSNSPDQSYWISKSELIHIESHMEPRVGSLKQSSVTASGFTINEMPLAKPAISWTKVASNRALLVLTIVMFTSEWSNMLLLVKLPGFLGPVLKLELAEIGLWSSVLVLTFCINYPLSGFLASRLEAANVDGLNSLRIRKIFEATAHGLQALGALMIALSADKTTIGAALLLMMLGRSVVGGGQCLMPPELSKDYPGTVFAYANSLANLAGFFGPNVLTLLVAQPELHASWRPLWLLSAAIFALGGLAFCLLAQNSPQNYCRRPKSRGQGGVSLSRAQLTEEPEVLRMEAFARVAGEPQSARKRDGAAQRF